MRFLNEIPRGALVDIERVIVFTVCRSPRLEIKNDQSIVVMILNVRTQLDFQCFKMQAYVAILRHTSVQPRAI